MTTKDGPFYTLTRVVVSDDSDQLDAALMALHMEGYTDWRKGTYMGTQGVHKAIVDINGCPHMTEWTYKIWPILKHFKVLTIGRGELRNFAREDENGISV